MPLQLVTPPSEEPVSLWEAKLHLRVDFDEDDMLIASLITAARQAAETLTGRQFTTARWKQVLDCFPGPSLMGVSSGQTFSLPGHAILLFKTPVQSVVSINYLDMGSVQQVMPADTYTVHVAADNFKPNFPLPGFPNQTGSGNGPLYGMISLSGSGAGDDNTSEDGVDATLPEQVGISSIAFALQAGNQPAGANESGFDSTSDNATMRGYAMYSTCLAFGMYSIG